MFSFRTRVAAVVAAVSVATLGLAAPAQADGGVSGRCQAGNIKPFWMNVSAFYVDDDAGIMHHWTHLAGALNGSAGDKSNVNAWFYQHTDGRDFPRGEYRSPDNVRGGDFHLIVEPNPTTRASEPEFVVFQAIFDKFGSDPSCSKRSETT
jgi:hypothetical protein